MQADTVETQTTDLEELSRLASQQRRNLLENLIQLRKNDFAYLRDLHTDPQNSYFLNIARIREESLNLSTVLSAENHSKRCDQLYYMGLSLGRILTIAPTSSHIAYDGCQLMDELDFYQSPSGIQNMKLVTVASKSTLYERGQSVKDHSEPYRSIIRKWNNKPVYQRLLTPNIAFPLDYCQLVVSLCDVLTLFFDRFMDDLCSSNQYVFQALLRFDEKIKKSFLDVINKQMSMLATTIIKDEIESLRQR